VDIFSHERAAPSTPQKPPRVDVGCLEEVLASIEGDARGEWSDVMFVPAGALGAGGAPPGPEPAGGKARE